MASRKQKAEKRIQELGSDWIGEQVVRLGNYAEVVETGVPGQYYARQNNGQVIKVINSLLTSPEFDKRVLVRRSRIQPNVWRIAEVFEDYDSPVSGGRIAAHHEQHEEAGFDRLKLDRKQISQLSCRVSGTWTVRLFGAVVQTSTGIVLIDNQDLDLSSYEMSTGGAKYVSIEVDSSGTVTINEGAIFGSPLSGTEADIPAPDTGKHTLAYVLFYEGQDSLSDDNIRVLSSLPGSGGSATWGAITGTLSDQTDLQAELDLKLEDAPSDGSLYGRKDGAWEAVSITLKALRLVMRPDLSSPPVPVETPDGEDWVYFEEDL